MAMMEPLAVGDFVTARLYEREDDVIQDALRYLMKARPDLRIRLVIYRYTIRVNLGLFNKRATRRNEPLGNCGAPISQP